MADRILTPDEIVALLYKYVAEGGHDSKMIASLVRQVIEDEMWREFVSPATGVVYTFPSFQDFVTQRKGGLGTTKTALVAWIGAADPEVAALVEKAWKGEIGAYGKRGRPAANEKGGATTITDRNTEDGILARLKRDDPDMAQAVVNGELSANAAALIKGWRKPRIVLTTTTSVANAIRKHRDPEWVAQLRRTLMTDKQIEIDLEGTPAEAAQTIREHWSPELVAELKTALEGVDR